MSILAPDERVSSVETTEDLLTVWLMDGRIISVPLVWYPRLFNATREQKNRWQVIGGGYGIHWPDIDEDLSTEGLLRGAPAPRLQSVNVRTAPVMGIKTVAREIGKKPGTSDDDEGTKYTRYRGASYFPDLVEAGSWLN